MHLKTMTAIVVLTGLWLGCADTTADQATPKQPSKMKMTTEIPEGIATPDRLETRLGTLRLFDGVPDEDTAQLVYDNLDFQRGVQAYLSSIQIASMCGMRKAILEFGPPNTTALLFEDLMDSKALWLTPNTVSIYMALWLELSDEPMVIETPPNVLGIIDDHWFHYVADFGNAGPDKGKGGTYVILPPDYKEGDSMIAEGLGALAGAHVVRSPTYGNWVIWRGFQVDGDTAPAVQATKELFRVYPLSRATNPPPMNFINVSGVFHSTIHRMDYAIFEEINEVVQTEPPEGQSPEILGLLASIGIKKGQPFAPDARMKKILTEAADVGAATVRALAARPRSEKFYYYPGERVWATPFPGGSHEFIEDGAVVLDGRAYFHFYATGITPAMTSKMVGKGSQYAMAYTDADGNTLDGSRTYKVHLPPNVPAKDFWSFTLYDNQTRAMLQTDQQFPGVSSVDEGVQQNADGSYDVYFGPEAPAGSESNWIQTVPGKGWNMLFRLYGPLEPWFDKTWRPGNPQLVK
jgi:hypothetical protein